MMTLTTPQDPEDLEKTLLTLERARADAWIRKNRKTLDAHYAPDFMEINYFGRLDAEELMNSLFPSLSMRTLTIEEPRFLRVGMDAAALTYRCREDLTVKGKPFTGIFHVTALYTRIEKDWRLLLWQITPWKTPPGNIRFLIRDGDLKKKKNV